MFDEQLILTYRTRIREREKEIEDKWIFLLKKKRRERTEQNRTDKKGLKLITFTITSQTNTIFF